MNCKESWMKTLRSLAGALLCVVATTGAGFAVDSRPLPRATVSISVAGQKTVLTKELVASLNAQRKAKGLRSLTLNKRLSRAAQRHVDDMIRRGYFSHTSPDGTRPLARVTKTGYKACLVAENLSYSWPTVNKATADWMGSSGHRANILNRSMKEVGIGIGPNNLFVAVFAKPC